MSELNDLWNNPSVPVELRTTTTSPFGRKVRMAAIILGLIGRITLRSADTRDPDDDLRSQNPLGKIPCLIIGPEAFYDSGVIIEMLDAVAQGGLIPADPLARARVMTGARLADGITEAALLMVYEGRFRDDAQASEVWLDHQLDKIARALAWFEAAPPEPAPGLVQIGLAAALGYLDWRQPMMWREDHPRLVAWLNYFAGTIPAFLQTERDAA